ncbi:melanin-concentrating hormone receptor 1-like [Astyanax mexicanus]|uniref:Melanin-concentrating hormone receptor 1 n=1 Tax=Astyanax mexicanus TaxID=7994 RepID=A0A8B9LRV6_ASTMX|nr:melanin-concentrating hormone receptor 1-like [Astyanax mexicanus]
MDFFNGSLDNSSVFTFNFSAQLTDNKTTQYDVILLPSIFGIICFLGIVGNCLVMYTIMKRTKCSAKQTVPDIFIFSLSIVDLLFLLGMPLLIHQLLGEGSWCFGSILCTVITTLDSNSQTVSTYILTVMTLDRYVATVHPIRFNHIRTPRVAVAMVVIVWLLSVISVTPLFLYTRLMPLPGGRVGCALLLPNPSIDIYWFTLYQFVLVFALPLAIICLVFFKILQHMSTNIAPLPPRSLQVRTKKVTRMAVAICSAFFTCWAPYYILQLVHLGIRQPSPTFYYTYNIAISMGYANSCISPFLYILLSDNFKRQLIVAVQPVHKRFRVNPSTTEGSVTLNLAPDGRRHSHSEDTAQ